MKPSNKLGDSGKKGNQKKKNVNVVVRVRPLSDTEIGMKNKNVSMCDSVNKIVQMKSTLSEKGLMRSFGPFDKVYGPESTQMHIYKESVESLVREVLNGYNCTVFAYGQTGSGKTYTMEGRHDDSNEFTWDNDPTSGIIPRALHHIFSELGDHELDYYTVRVSYVEMYNEQIFDLLSTSKSAQQESLRIYDDNNKGVTIVGMEEITVKNRDEVYKILARGAEKRRTASTLMNINSSRSHSVFTVNVMMREPGCLAGEELLRQGKLNLVDLAGSENIGRSGATEMRAREAGNINVSLLALGRVINALTANAPHIPYRESKLTRILQDSLGGKTITTIIATIVINIESVNTLEYAQRAKNIKNNPEINQKITRKALLKEYNEEIERLRRDLVAMREKQGVYMDKENYDHLIEQQDEYTAKIEELEGRLDAYLYQVKKLSEDLGMMDEHYQRVYMNCQKALGKLEIRKRELEGLHKELADTKDIANAANNALLLSENSFTKLRSQAFDLQEKCAIYHGDLTVLHDRLDKHRDISALNDHLLGNFASERIHSISKAKMEIQNSERASDMFSEQLKQIFKEVVETVVEKMNAASSIVDDQKVSIQKAADSLTLNLIESQNAVERFAHQEFQRIQKTGSTPVRRVVEYEDLEDLPPAAELIKQEQSSATPRRASGYYQCRESMLEGDIRSTLLSPDALKSTFVQSRMKLETVEENSTEDQRSSKHVSLNDESGDKKGFNTTG
ncbi:kinesin motor domain-containing protein [Ditylenchus destructor]|nr:kinesin motor domain-containing protein [Ditylenchus destructor]